MPSSSLILSVGALTLSAFLAPVSATLYGLKDNYSGATFFDGFDFNTFADPTHGYVQYLNEADAKTAGLVKNVGTAAYIGVDSTKSYGPTATGRPSVRIATKNTYNHGLFIADIAHMPGSACGSWPAFWSLGDGTWPANGEIDIIEGVNKNDKNLMVLHTADGCSVANTGMTGTLNANNCDVSFSASGCSVTPNESNTYGTNFNSNGGGVYAMEWTSTAIKMWFFPRSSIPASITAGAPDTTKFGTPTAAFAGSCDIDAHFKNHKFIFDTTFCGDWAGNVYGQSGCPMSDPDPIKACVAYVGQNPSAFAQSYWQINSFKAYTALPAVSSTSTQPSSTSTKSSSTSTQSSSTSTQSSLTSTQPSSTSTQPSSTSTQPSSTSTKPSSTSTKPSSTSTQPSSTSTTPSSTSIKPSSTSTKPSSTSTKPSTSTNPVSSSSSSKPASSSSSSKPVSTSSSTLASSTSTKPSSSSTASSTGSSSSSVASSSSSVSSSASSSVASSSSSSAVSSSSSISSSASSSASSTSSSSTVSSTSNTVTPTPTPTGPVTCPESDGSCSDNWMVTCGIDYYGADDASSPQIIYSLAGCIAACQDIDTCVAVSWLAGIDGGPAFCYLKSSVTDEVPNETIQGAKKVTTCPAASSSSASSTVISTSSSVSSAASSSTDVSSSSSATSGSSSAISSTSADSSSSSVASTSSSVASSSSSVASSSPSVASSSSSVASSSASVSSSTDVFPTATSTVSTSSSAFLSSSAGYVYPSSLGTGSVYPSGTIYPSSSETGAIYPNSTISHSTSTTCTESHTSATSTSGAVYPSSLVYPTETESSPFYATTPYAPYPTASTSKATITTTITTTYIDVCSTGYTTSTITKTVTYCPGDVSSGGPAPGFTTKVTICEHCAAYPTTVTLTVPVYETPAPVFTAPFHLASSSTKEADVSASLASYGFAPLPYQSAAASASPSDSATVVTATNVVYATVVVSPVPASSSVLAAAYTESLSVPAVSVVKGTGYVAGTGAVYSTGAGSAVYPTGIAVPSASYTAPNAPYFTGAASRASVGVAGVVGAVVVALFAL